MNLKEDEPCSDDEVFYGRLLSVVISRHRHAMTANECLEDDNHNTSLKLISTHSEPDITTKHKDINLPDIIPTSQSNLNMSSDEPNQYVKWDVTSSENSVLNLGKLVENSCESSAKEELDNTLEEIERILKNPPTTAKKNTLYNDYKSAECKDTDIEKNKIRNKENEGKLALKPSAMVTPVKQDNQKEAFATPSSVLRTKPSIAYQTPANTPLFKKPSTSSLKKTPGKNNAFQHVESPVAYYINKSPQIPLIQNVHPKKTLSGLSFIPKLVKSNAVKPSNTENVSLPSVAYKSAKKTTMIDVSDGPKMPQSQWAKKLTKSLPRPAVIKHTYREKEFYKPKLRNPEDSFGDLTLQQADISVCTKKTAI